METKQQWRRRSLAVVTATVMALSILVAGAREARAQAGPVGLRNPIERVDVVNGALVAVTTQGQQLPIGLSATRQAGAPCPILNLSLGPINLNVLGLAVDTSQICLDVTAVPSGGLLGQLLCGVARLLDGGVPLADILAGLRAQQLATLLGALTDILNGALNRLNDAAVTAVAPGQVGCDVLNLALGPLDLNILGLRVELDNCNNGPVTVDVTAVPGPGNLLGNLLCGLLGGIDIGTTLGDLIGAVIDALIGALG